MAILLCSGYFELVKIMRTRHFVEENKVDPSLEFDDKDPTARHIMGLVGDAPVVCARWRMEATGS